MNLKPIGYIHTDFKDKFGIPRQSGRVPELQGRIFILPEYARPEAFRGIETFSHLWLIFDFSKSHRESWSPTVRPPRLGGNQRLGVFATRSPFRPNPVGLSCVRFENIVYAEKSIELLVSGVDVLDQTPILDIKPYLPYADSYPDAEGSYAQALQGYHLDVDFPAEFLSRIPEGKRQALRACLAEDPRPSYQDNPERIYHMNFAGFEIHFRVRGQKLEVTGLERELSNR